MDKVNNSMSEINQVIDGKSKLPFEVQGDIKQLLSILVPVFDLDTSYIAQKIADLEIVKKPKYGEYENIVGKGNKVLIDPKLVLKSKSGKNIYIEAILKYLYPNNTIGLQALYNGTIEMASNAAVGDSNTSDEFVMCDLLSRVMEPDMSKPEPLMTSLFSGNMASCLTLLRDKGVKNEEIVSLMDIANQNYMTSGIRSKSNLASIERVLIDFKFRQNPTKEEMMDFSESLRINSELYGGKRAEYADLDVLRNEYEKRLEEYLNSIEHSKVKG